ncbi:MAG: hypothetical protein Q4C98_10135 [Capnocytophaga sp.]|nr:hypothetical protein [Capnocytophaga sp.]
MKYLFIFLVLASIFGTAYGIISGLDHWDIPSNKNDTYAAWQKREIMERTDISLPEKELLAQQIDLKRKYERQISKIAISFQEKFLVIFVIQILLLVLIFLVKIEFKWKKKNGDN